MRKPLHQIYIWLPEIYICYMFLKWSLRRGHRGLQGLLALSLRLICFCLISNHTPGFKVLLRPPSAAAPPPGLALTPRLRLPFLNFIPVRISRVFSWFCHLQVSSGRQGRPRRGGGMLGGREPSDDNFRAALSKSGIMMRGAHARPFPVCSPGKSYQRIEKGRGEGPMGLGVVGGGN